MTKDFVLVGLTGGLGTGKTTVARMFRKMGAEVFDADTMAHRLLRKGTAEYRGVVAAFGRKILDRNAEIDRRRLAEEVFGHPRRLSRLTRIIHPPVIAALRRKLRRSRTRVRMAVIPLLYEAGLSGWFDCVVVVSARTDLVRKRLRASRGMAEGQIRQRLRAQLPLRRKARRADFVIDNNGSKRSTRAQVRNVWKELTGLLDRRD